MQTFHIEMERMFEIVADHYGNLPKEQLILLEEIEKALTASLRRFE